MTCLAHRCADVLRPYVLDTSYYQVRSYNADGAPVFSHPQRNWGEVFDCLEPSQEVCRRVLGGWTRKQSWHAALYRGLKRLPPRHVLIWADVDRWSERCEGMPLWLSRWRGPTRGVVLLPRRLGAGSDCSWDCAWRHLALKTGGDKSAAHSKHTFRIPGISAPKDFDSSSRDIITLACRRFLTTWEIAASNPALFALHVIERPVRRQTREPSAGITGVLRPQTVELARAAWRTGSRHYAAMGYAGAIRRAGFPMAVAERLVTEMCHAEGDSEIDDRLRAVKSTYELPLERVGGISILRELCHGQETN